MKEYVIDVDILLGRFGQLWSGGIPKARRNYWKPCARQTRLAFLMIWNRLSRIISCPTLNVEDSADILEEMEEEDAAEVASRIESGKLATILDHMEPDEAADLLGDIRRKKPTVF